MTPDDDLFDQDALSRPVGRCARSLKTLRPRGRSAEAAANELTEAMSEQWAHGRRELSSGSRQIRRRAYPLQEEIDNLLGFSDGEVNLDENSGIRAIIDSAMVSYERLPMLEIVFDRLVRLMTTQSAQLYVRQRGSVARPHHVRAFR